MVSGRFGNAGADAHEHVMEVPRHVTEAAPAHVPQMAGNPVLERTRKRWVVIQIHVQVKTIKRETQAHLIHTNYSFFFLSDILAARLYVNLPADLIAFSSVQQADSRLKALLEWS